MSESEELHNKVDKILKKVESIDNFMPWLVRPNSPQLKKELLTFFKKRKTSARVYLVIDGVKTVGEVATSLNMKQPNVSREIKLLNGFGLIEAVIDGSNSIYKKNKIDNVLGLSNELSKLIPTNAPEQASDSDSSTKEGRGENSEEGNNNIIEDTSTSEEKRL